MKFHGRMEPGRLTDLGEPVEVRIHQPAKASAVTIKIWELDASIGANGKQKRDGSPDDLLATFTGSIEPAPPGGRPPEWRKFVVDTVKIEEAPKTALRFSLQFPGSETTYEIPVISEVGELEGAEYELGFSMEVGGAEKFRTKVPCMLSFATVRPRVKELLIVGFDDKNEPILDGAIELPPSVTVASIGVPPDDFDEDSTDMAMLDKKLEHVTPLVLDPSGFLFTEDTKVSEAGGVEHGRAMTLRKGKKVRALLTSKDGKTASLSYPVDEDGTITVYRVDTTHRISLFVGGGDVKTETRRGAQVATFSGLFDASKTVTLTGLKDEDG